MHRRTGFTLIELIAVIVVLAVLAGVALPKYFDHSNDAEKAADEAAIAGLETALMLKHLENRSKGLESSKWIEDLVDVTSVMDTFDLPEGITWDLDDQTVTDQRKYVYAFQAETAISPAKFGEPTGGPGGGGAEDGGGGGDGGGAGGAAIPPHLIVIALIPWLVNDRRRSVE